MNTTRTRYQRRPPAANARYNRYYVMRIRRLAGREWRAFVAKGYDEAMRKAENVQGCLEVTEIHEVSREEYLNAIDNINKGVK